MLEVMLYIICCMSYSMLHVICYMLKVTCYKKMPQSEEKTIICKRQKSAYQLALQMAKLFCACAKLFHKHKLCGI